MRTFDTGLATLGLHVTPVIAAASDWSYVYVRLAEGNSTVRGPEHHWSLRTSRSCAPVNVFVTTMLLNGWTLKASP